MRYGKICFILITTTLVFACNNDEDHNRNEKIIGRWYYTNLPNSYIEISKNGYSEHISSLNSTIIYNIHWIDTLHFELTVRKISGPVKGTLQIGEKIQIEIRELTAHYYRFNLTYKGKPQCILLVKQKNYKGHTGTPC